MKIELAMSSAAAAWIDEASLLNFAMVETRAGRASVRRVFWTTGEGEEERAPKMSEMEEPRSGSVRRRRG